VLNSRLSAVLHICAQPRS